MGSADSWRCGRRAAGRALGPLLLALWRRRGSLAAGIAGIIAGLLSIFALYGWPYLSVVQQIGEVSSGGFFLILWSFESPWPPSRFTLMIAGSIALILGGLILLILVRRDRRPKLCRALVIFSVAGSVVMIGAATYQVLWWENVEARGIEPAP